MLFRSQRPGFDDLETFAPTVRLATIRSTLALAAIKHSCLRSMDISHAFTKGKLEEEIYMRQPEGYHFGKQGDVLKLKKSLYGLKQAGRVWNETLDKALVSMSFKQLKSDPSTYVYGRDGARVTVPVFIDDIC